MGTYVGCIPISVPRMFYRRGKLTRFGRITVWTVSVLVVGGAIATRMAKVYAAY